MPIEWAIQSSGDILRGMMGIEGLASRLLVVIMVIGCHLTATARPFGVCCPFEMLSIREVCKWLSLGSTCLALLDYLHWMSPFARVSLRTWDVVCFGGVGRCSTFRRTVALVMQRSSRHYTGEGCGKRNMSKEDCYLVDPASSHMLVSKIKPCMFKKLVVGPWVGSIGPPLVCTGRLVPSAGDALLALIGRVVPPVLIGVMINRDSRGHSYFIVRGEILGFMKDEQLRKHLPRMFFINQERKLGPRRRVWKSIHSAGSGPSPLEGGAGEGESPVVPGPCRTTGRCRRDGLFGNAAPIGREADGGWQCVPVRCGTALAGMPIGSGCGPMQITATAQAQAVDMPVETSSSQLWMAARAVWRASAPARSWRRPAGSPLGLS
ncbi:putative rRNA intron-encoded homing endonuclease [Senna tora]|uniref:Putative rRNA intron-encoded homing endonuclease n=1 Tax=Senna tora TaxID=362788 RepID=A0A834W373_9FABA|nr:putative rRNA intron-encoded homing endonuclease [Senna tora]